MPMNTHNTVAPTMNKSILARLLASENITILHEDVQTASFDLKNRVLRLPKWANTTTELYDMLIGHEVSHALHTPQDEWKSGMERIAAATEYPIGMSKTYMNIVEDARIERMIKTKFPGLKRDFFMAYDVLVEKKIFGDISKPETLCLGDRLNLHFKIGIHSGMKIPFASSELQWIKAMEETKTFEEVILLTIDIMNSLAEGDSDNPQTQVYTQSDDSGIDGSSESEGEATDGGKGGQDSGAGEGQEQGDGDGCGEAEGESKGQGKEQGKGKRGGVGGRQGQTPHTNDSMDKNIQETFIDAPKNGSSSTPPDTIRVKFPPQHKCVISYSRILKDVRGDIAGLDQERQDWINNLLKPVADPEFRAASLAMASSFNRKKSADVFKRSSIARTGNLDTLRMNQYRWTDDVFRRTVKIAEGKNHGIVILLDWSSSMQSIMRSTIGQLIILTDFCRLVGIPFEVYAFTDRIYRRTPVTPIVYDAVTGQRIEDPNDESIAHRNTYAKDQVILNPINLLNFLSSKMSKPDYEFGKSFLYNLTHIGHRMPHDHNFQLGGTPTVSALYEMSYLIREFRESTNVQVCHTVILTDGEAGDHAYLNHDFLQESRGGKYYSNNIAGVMDDPITGASYDIQRVFDHSKYKNGVAPMWKFGSVVIPENVKSIDVWIACDIIRRRTQSQLHWISLSQRDSFSPSSFGMESKSGCTSWKRDGFTRGNVAGFDSTTIISTRKFTQKSQYSRSAPAPVVSVSMSKNQLQKSFIESQTAVGGLKIVATIIGERLGTS